MDLSIVTNFLNFLLSYNIILFLKQCFKFILGPLVSTYEELTPFSTVVTLYDDLIKSLFKISGAIAHGFSFNKYRLSVANRVFEAEYKKLYEHQNLESLGVETLGVTPQELANLKTMAETWESDPETWPSNSVANMNSEEKEILEQFIGVINKFAPRKKIDIWKGLLLLHMLQLNNITLILDYGDVALKCRKTDLLAYTKAALEVDKEIGIQDLKDSYSLFVPKESHKLIASIFVHGVALYEESKEIIDEDTLQNGGSEKVNETVASVVSAASADKLDSNMIHLSVIRAAKSYALYSKIPVEAAYRATGILYNPSALPESEYFQIETGSVSEYNNRTTLLAVAKTCSYKTSKAVIYGCMCIHYFAVILFGAGQIIGITILGANVWNPFDSSSAHSIRDILRNNIKYTIVLVVFLVLNLVVPNLMEIFLDINRLLSDGTIQTDCSKSGHCSAVLRYLALFVCRLSKWYSKGLDLPLWRKRIIFTNHANHVLNLHTPIATSAYTGISNKILTYSQKKHIGQLQEVETELTLLYFLLNFIALPIAMMRYSRLYTQLFGEVYTEF